MTSFAANRAGWAKDRLSEISELSSVNEDVPARAPTTGPTKVDQTRFKDLKVHPSFKHVFQKLKKWSRMASLIITIPKFNISKILTGARRKER